MDDGLDVEFKEQVSKPGNRRKGVGPKGVRSPRLATSIVKSWYVERVVFRGGSD